MLFSTLFVRFVPRAGRSALALALVSAGAFVACGGAEASLLEESPVSGAGGADASSPSPTTDASTGPVKGNDAGAPAKDSGGVTTKDAAPTPVVDSSTGVDSAPPPAADPGITCGKKACDPTSEVCCVTTNGGGGGGGGGTNGQSFDCSSAADCDNNGGTSLPCEKAADCTLAGAPAGTVCCVTQGGQGNGSGPTVACVAQADCADPASQAWMCDQSAPACPAGDTCRTSTVTIPPYSICAP